MKISVIGCGYLGAVHAVSMATLGHEVVGIDTAVDKVNRLKAGEAPFFEPGLPELLASGLARGRLRFSTEMSDAAGSDIHFIAVGTPQLPGSDAADLRFLDAAIAALTPFAADALIVGKSTVPVGTARRLAETLAPSSNATLVWNPEFLREGFAIEDTLSPDRLVYGLPEGEAGERAQALLDELYATSLAAGTPRIAANYETAELVKVAANAFLATKISFINAMAEIAEVTGADVTQLADAIGHDDRIGRRFLNAGLGFGGGCLPKDIRAFTARAEELGKGESVSFLRSVDAINLRRRDRVVDLTVQALENLGPDARVAILGLAFKPNSDDVRDSPALDVAVRLDALGANVTAYDPQAMNNAWARHPHLDYARSLDDAIRDAQVIVVATEWQEFTTLRAPAVVDPALPRVVIDARNCLQPPEWSAAGWRYVGLGRPAP